MNTELDVTDKISCCCWPLVLLKGFRYRTSYSENFHLHVNASGSEYVVGLLFWKITRVCIMIYVMIFLSEGGGIAVVHSGEVLEPPSSPGVNTSNLTEEASAS